jgi:hypothetical protein
VLLKLVSPQNITSYPWECGQLGIWEVILENEKNNIKMLKMLVEEIKKYFNNRHSPPQRPDTNVGM